MTPENGRDLRYRMMGGYLFPQWIDRIRLLVGILAAAVPLYVVGAVYYAGSPRTTNLGYMPKQPVPFSHAVHAGDLGIDCRYCHTTVESAAEAAIPSTEICMNCHTQIAAQSAKLLPVRESHATGEPIRWVRVHDLPDFVYFNHGVHVSQGVSCVSCHGHVNKMEEVYQVEPLTMGWCLRCHRQPEAHLRPPELVTDLDWVPGGDPIVLGRRLREENNIQPSTNCSTCHR